MSGWGNLDNKVDLATVLVVLKWCKWVPVVDNLANNEGVGGKIYHAKWIV